MPHRKQPYAPLRACTPIQTCGAILCTNNFLFYCTLESVKESLTANLNSCHSPPAQTTQPSQPQQQQPLAATPTSTTTATAATTTTATRVPTPAPAPAQQQQQQPTSRAASQHPDPATTGSGTAGFTMPAEAAPHGAPVRQYINSKITGVLLEGMKIVAREQ